jgi:uncharacterized protein YvpB
VRKLAFNTALRFLVIIIALSLVAGCSPQPESEPAGTNGDPSQQVEEGQNRIGENLFIFTTVDDFKGGTTEGTEISASGNGTIVLKDGVTSGSYTSDIINTSNFEYMIMSWSADTPRGSYIELEARIRVLDQWSDWLSWGEWSIYAFEDEYGQMVLPGSAPSSKRDDPLAKVDTDELYTKGGSRETADAFQYRVTLHAAKNDPDAKPRVTLVASTIRNTFRNQAVPYVIPEGAPDLSNFEADLDVPTYSQMIRDIRIGNSICSPTSVAMVLQYHGIDISPEQSAWAARDYGAPMFGNWPFNVASATAYGFTGYVAYCTPAPGADPWYPVKEQIAAGNPVVVSVQYQSPSGTTSYPIVEGVPITSTGGHLVLVRGFTWKDGVEYVIVNDAAAPDNESVRREYKANQFADAWVKKVAYIIYNDPNEISEPTIPTHIDGQLVPVGSPADGIQKFRFMVDGEALPLDENSINSIVVSYNGEKSTPVQPRRPDLTDADLLFFDTTSKSGTYTFIVIDKNKYTYKAVLEWN